MIAGLPHSHNIGLSVTSKTGCQISISGVYASCANDGYAHHACGDGDDASGAWRDDVHVCDASHDASDACACVRVACDANDARDGVCDALPFIYYLPGSPVA